MPTGTVTFTKKQAPPSDVTEASEIVEAKLLAKAAGEEIVEDKSGKSEEVVKNEQLQQEE